MAAPNPIREGEKSLPRRDQASVPWCLAAAGLILGSAALQLVASLQRWVTAYESWTRTDRLVEDNLFDYSYPADPWENVGTAAQQFGAGYLLLSLGMLALLRAAPPSQTVRMRVLALVVACSLALDGGHALVTGLINTPTPVQHVLVLQWLLSLAGFLSLIVLGALWWRTSRAVALAYAFLLGTTVPGYLCSMYLLAPLVTGYQSFDTTPWTETIVAGSTAAAGVTVLVAAGVMAVGRAALSKPLP